MKLDIQTRKKLKLFKQAQRAERNLQTKPYASRQQRDAWKQIMVKAYRTFPTEAEARLLPHLAPLHFIHQYFVCGYIADFAHVGKRVIVELDGGSHLNRKAYDEYRDAVLRQDSWIVLRFPNAAHPFTIVREVGRYIT